MGDTALTVGVDIGTSSVKAAAADAAGAIVADARVPHDFRIPAPVRLEHDASVWCSGPRRAIEALGLDAAAGVSVAAMVPSLAAVDAAGEPISPGLLYGDERGDTGSAASSVASGEFAAFLHWLTTEYPQARGYWPAQALANHALAGRPVISTTVAATALPLFDWVGWDEAETARAGARVSQLPDIAPSLQPVGEVEALGGAVLEGGAIDALGEQIVSGADNDGDVLVICGTTLIVWVVSSSAAESPGYYSVPHTTSDKWLLGGPSNGGGMFLDWARRLVANGGAGATPDSIPLWIPYVRGERVPLADRSRRAELVGLDLTHGPTEVRRAAFEAAGFVTRRMIEASPVECRRIVAVGGGVRVPEWLSALADCTGLPVHVSGTHLGGALGAAFLARVAAGLEADTSGASRWARTAAIVEPDPSWIGPCEERYRRWCERAD